MSKQQHLIEIPRRPSLTAAVTRARRNAARAWARERGLETWARGTNVCVGVHRDLPWGSSVGGALLPIGDGSEGVRKLCWDCLPVPGSPLHAWEHWSDWRWDAKVCIRCRQRLNGGSYSRGGPFCWTCIREAPIPNEVRTTWLLALRDQPDLMPPWAGDRVQP